MKRLITLVIVTLVLLVGLSGNAFASHRSLRGAKDNFVIVLPPSGPSSVGRSIEISLSQQRLWTFFKGKLVRTFLVSTGRPGFRTPSGRFHVLAKGRNWFSHKWQVWMPYALNFFENYNLHSLPYATPGNLIGASELGRPRSHGCVRIAPDNARWLFYWTPIGTPVWIH